MTGRKIPSSHKALVSQKDGQIQSRASPVRADTFWVSSDCVLMVRWGEMVNTDEKLALVWAAITCSEQ